MRTRTLALCLLVALPSAALLPGAGADPSPEDCLSQQPVQAGDNLLWRVEDNGGSFAVGVRDYANDVWQIASNDCSLLAGVFACNAIQDVDPTFPGLPVCALVGSTVDLIEHDGWALVRGNEDGRRFETPVCTFTTSHYGPGPWECNYSPPNPRVPLTVSANESGVRVTLVTGFGTLDLYQPAPVIFHVGDPQDPSSILPADVQRILPGQG